jgi:hypothetical protein
LASSDDFETELEIALFIYYQPAVTAFVAAHQSAGIRAATGYFLELRSDASLGIYWFDGSFLRRTEVVVVLGYER